MKRCAILLTLVGLSSLAHAAAEPVKLPLGRLVRNACDPGLVMEPQDIRASLLPTARRQPGDGIVHPRAAVGRLRDTQPPIWVAIDAADPGAEALDLLRFDFSGTGQFAGKDVVNLKNVLGGKRRISVRFPPTTLAATRDGHKILVTVKGTYTRSSNNDHQLTLQLGTALEGACNFGGKRRTVRLVDGNANLNCTDKAAPAPGDGGLNGHDTVVVYGDGGPVKGYYGHPIFVGGAWYDVTLSDDGSAIAAKPTGAKMATLKIAQQDWTAKLIGSKYILNLHGSAKPVTIPADRYTVGEFRQRSAPDAEGRTGSFTLTWVPSRGKADRTFHAVAGQTAEVPLGTPLTARMDASVDGRTVELTLNVLDVSGAEVCRVTRPDGDWAKPKFRVLDEKGKIVLSESLGYN